MKGDRGGPLITTDGNAVQVGVVSWKFPFPCKSTTHPGVYARYGCLKYMIFLC